MSKVHLFFTNSRKSGIRGKEKGKIRENPRTQNRQQTKRQRLEAWRCCCLVLLLGIVACCVKFDIAACCVFDWLSREERETRLLHRLNKDSRQPQNNKTALPFILSVPDTAQTKQFFNCAIVDIHSPVLLFRVVPLCLLYVALQTDWPSVILLKKRDGKKEEREKRNKEDERRKKKRRKTEIKRKREREKRGRERKKKERRKTDRER